MTNKGINCIYNIVEFRCNSKNVKRSFFGIGPRVCMHEIIGQKCEHQERKPRPNIKPAPQKKIKTIEK